MSTDQWIWLALAIVFGVVAMLMMCVETAYQAMTPTRADRLVEEGRKGSAAVKEITDDPAPELTAATLLRILSEIGSMVLIFALFFTTDMALWAKFTLSILVIAIISFTAWWVVPKTLGRLHEDRIACASGRFLTVLYRILWPICQLLIWFSNAITPGPGWADGPLSAEAEMIAEASEGEREMIKSVFELGDTLVREVMVPRTDIVFLEHDKTLRQGLSLALRSGFSRIPVVGKDIDEILGVLYVKDAMRRVYDNPDAEKTQTVDSIMRPAAFVPDSKPVDDLMREMQISRNHLVIVVDEFGGVAGLASMEDLVEEIVGEITDEFDAEPDLVQEVEPGVFRISSRMAVDDMGELFGLEVEDEDVETVGGLMAKELNRVPIPGSEVVWQGISIIAERATARRHQIDTVLVSLAPEPEESEDDVDTELVEA